MSAVSRILVLGDVGSGKCQCTCMRNCSVQFSEPLPGKSAFVHCASAVAAAKRSARPITSPASVTAGALSKCQTVGIHVVEMQYASAKFVFTQVNDSSAVV